MRPFEYLQGGDKKGKQGVIIGLFGIGSFLEKHFSKVGLLLCTGTSHLHPPCCRYSPLTFILLPPSSFLSPVSSLISHLSSLLSPLSSLLYPLSSLLSPPSSLLSPLSSILSPRSSILSPLSSLPPPRSSLLARARVKAWCIFIHAKASLYVFL